eukprot:COSAG06_NODE_9091_length_1989_cov_1.165608_2_plen_174_part_00
MSPSHPQRTSVSRALFGQGSSGIAGQGAEEAKGTEGAQCYDEAVAELGWPNMTRMHESSKSCAQQRCHGFVLLPLQLPPHLRSWPPTHPPKVRPGASPPTPQTRLMASRPSSRSRRRFRKATPCNLDLGLAKRKVSFDSSPARPLAPHPSTRAPLLRSSPTLSPLCRRGAQTY